MRMSHLNSVSLPGLSPEEEHGDAGEEASEKAAEEAALAEVLAVAVHQTARAAGAAHA